MADLITKLLTLASSSSPSSSSSSLLLTLPTASTFASAAAKAISLLPRSCPPTMAETGQGTTKEQLASTVIIGSTSTAYELALQYLRELESVVPAVKENVGEEEKSVRALIADQ